MDNFGRLSTDVLQHISWIYYHPLFELEEKLVGTSIIEYYLVIRFPYSSSRIILCAFSLDQINLQEIEKIEKSISKFKKIGKLHIDSLGNYITIKIKDNIKIHSGRSLTTLPLTSKNQLVNILQELYSKIEILYSDKDHRFREDIKNLC